MSVDDCIVDVVSIEGFGDDPIIRVSIDDHSVGEDISFGWLKTPDKILKIECNIEAAPDCDKYNSYASDDNESNDASDDDEYRCTDDRQCGCCHKCQDLVRDGGPLFW